MKIFEDLKEAVLYLKKGKVIICPTDTVYGLVCDATNEKAVKRLFKIKKREPGKFLPIFVRDIRAAKKYAIINKGQEAILRKVWPGKTTVVLKRKNSVLYGVDKKTIALRAPDCKVVNYLLLSINRPLTGTSANISGLYPSCKINEVINQFKNQKFGPDGIIDAGNLKESRPSKIIDLTDKSIKVLRK